jgi:hypothetical protein
MRRLALVVSHLAVFVLGFGAGVYWLPILTAPSAPSTADVRAAAAAAEYKGTFRRDLEGSDLLHWGEGTVFVGRDAIALDGRVAPGPDYKLYLAPEFVATKAAFERVKARSLRVGDVRTFDNFVVPIGAPIDLSAYDTVVVWCESFSQFISAARYR